MDAKTLAYFVAAAWLLLCAVAIVIGAYVFGREQRAKGAEPRRVMTPMEAYADFAEWEREVTR